MKKLKMTKYGDYEEMLPIPTFLYEMKIIFTDDIDRSKNARLHVFRDDLKDSEGNRALHVTVPDGTSYLFYRTGKFKTGEDWASPGVIAHEAWHAVYSMFIKWAGVKDLDNETVAYHLGYVVDHIHNIKSKVEEAIKNEPIHATQGKSTGVQGMQSTTTTGKREAH